MTIQSLHSLHVPQSELVVESSPIDQEKTPHIENKTTYSQDTIQSASSCITVRRSVLSSLKERVAAIFAFFKNKIKNFISIITFGYWFARSHGISSASEDETFEISTREKNADLTEELNGIVRGIHANKSHYAKLHALRNLIRREKMASEDDNVQIDNAIKEAYRFLPNTLQQAITYYISTDNETLLIEEESEDGVAKGKAHFLANPRSQIAFAAVEKIFYQLPSTIYAENQVIVLNPHCSDVERIHAFVNILNLDLNPKVSEYSIAGPECNQEQLKKWVKDLLNQIKNDVQLKQYLTKVQEYLTSSEDKVIELSEASLPVLLNAFEKIMVEDLSHNNI